MSAGTHLAFPIKRSEIRDGILIPKYYDPDVNAAITLATEAGYDIVPLRELLLPGTDGSKLGSWIRREHYGTGNVPYVRTSDISQWRIRPDFKKGVAEELYEKLKESQDVQAFDLLMVAHGTYLVGTMAIVMPGEERLILQDHVFRLRLAPAASVDVRFLLGLLSTNFVRRQIRSRQFSADIIDKIGNRHLEVTVAIPRDAEAQQNALQFVSDILDEQTCLRKEMMNAVNSDLRMTRERAVARHGFSVKRQQVRGRILIPKYYDPDLDMDLRAADAETIREWVSVGDLVDRGMVELTTGIEVGKMAYGTGNIPFIRTSDIAGWQVKQEVRHGVSEDVYTAFKGKAALQENDILVVRDGTYLVGSSAIVTGDDVPALICGGLFRLRVLSQNELSPFSLLGLLNLPIVRRQMRARQFTRDVIDTLGQRFLEIRLPDPSEDVSIKIGARVEDIVTRQKRLKLTIGSVISGLEPPSPPQARGRPGWSMR